MGNCLCVIGSFHGKWIPETWATHLSFGLSYVGVCRCITDIYWVSFGFDLSRIIDISWMFDNVLQQLMNCNARHDTLWPSPSPTKKRSFATQQNTWKNGDVGNASNLSWSLEYWKFASRRYPAWPMPQRTFTLCTKAWECI